MLPGTAGEITRSMLPLFFFFFFLQTKRRDPLRDLREKRATCEFSSYLNLVGVITGSSSPTPPPPPLAVPSRLLRLEGEIHSDSRHCFFFSFIKGVRKLTARSAGADQTSFWPASTDAAKGFRENHPIRHSLERERDGEEEEADGVA